MRRLGLKLDKFSVIHVAGTKGKGSTCAFTEAILRAHGLRTGLFTSPHLISFTERVRLGGRPCEPNLFCKYFWEVWDRLSGAGSLGKTQRAMPRFFQLLTLLALYIFEKERVDAVVLETGVGGRLDATNVFAKPIATGITSIGYDHCATLGNTLTSIAGEKAGIFKPGVPAYCAPQFAEARRALEAAAIRYGVEGKALVTTGTLCGACVRTDKKLLGNDPAAGPTAPITKASPKSQESGFVLGLKGDHQKDNAALAMALANRFIAARTSATPAAPADSTQGSIVSAATLFPALDQSKLRAALEGARWPGRCHVVSVGVGRAGGVARGGSSAPSKEGRAMHHLCIDGAHTKHSCRVAAEWFVAEARRRVAARGAAARVVVRCLFNCSKNRDPVPLLRAIVAPLRAANITPSLFMTCPFNFEKLSFKQPMSFAELCEKHKLSPAGATRKALRQDAAVDGKSAPGSTWQNTIANVWSAIDEEGRGSRSERRVASTVIESKNVSESISTLQVLAEKEAGAHASRGSDPRDLLQMTFVCGSLYLAGNVLEVCRFSV